VNVKKQLQSNMHHPQLNLGLLGFTPEQRAQVQSYVAQNTAQAAAGAPDDGGEPVFKNPVWQITGFREANALLLNTGHARADDAQIVRFSSGTHSADALGVRLTELAVPYALCGGVSPPIDVLATRSAPRVALEDERSVVLALQHFEAALRPLRTVYALAQELIQRRSELDNKHTYHLMRRGTLDVIVDVPQRRVLVRDGLRPFDLDEAAWQPRPMSANSLPMGFSVWMLEEVAWIHALHCHAFNLPGRYRRKPLHLRRMPRVRASLIYPRHADLLEALGKEGCDYDSLVALHPEHADQLKRDLYALYVCRAITTNPDGVTMSDSPASSQPPQSTHGVKPSTQVDFHLQTRPAELF
jgi:hypothetical protein